MWSTRELADLAGTTLRAVRHYHEVGLLEEPPRHANGYKQYGVRDLLRVLRIRRLTDLGFSLSQVAAMFEEDVPAADTFDELEARLTEQIRLLERARAEVRSVRERSLDVVLPPELAHVEGAARLSAADRSFVVVMSRVVGARGVQAWRDFLTALPEHPAAAEFDALTDDADEATRQDLAERLVEYVDLLHAQHPGIGYEQGGGPGAGDPAAQVASAAVAHLYNDAQQDVMARLGRLRRRPRRGGGTRSPSPARSREGGP